ncbi:MAG TPA: MFS transporter [Caldilineaceae bacterium]|nr:MFS transporter [Caldilineaceae bacterium]
MPALFHLLSTRIDRTFREPLAPDVRRNMYLELVASLAYGIFYAAAIQYIPVVLRRLGASSELLALYTAQTYLGSILTSLSIVLMRRRRPKNFVILCWLVSRSLFMLFALVSQVHWLLVVTAFFWLLETFPSPGYTRIIQVIYPERVRGQILGVVRLGMVAAMIVATPLAGWALDVIGYRVLFPLAGLVGAGAMAVFNQLHVDEGPLPPRETRSIASLWQIVRTNRAFALHLLSFAIYGMGGLLGYPLYAIVQVDRLQLSYTTIGLLGIGQSVAWLVGFLVWGRLVDSRGGLPVLRINQLISVIVPLAYVFATDGWMLIPAFFVQGLINAGVDIGLISTCIQLADKDRVVEYAAVQATVVGLRGMITPFLGAALLRLGMVDTTVFALGAALIFVSWLILLPVRGTPATLQNLPQRRVLRARWPLRWRFPRQ